MDCKQERRRGMRRMLLIIIVLTFTCCDVRVGGVMVWRSPVSWIDDALHRLNGDESHAGRGE
jgi:hypothetical protein